MAQQPLGSSPRPRGVISLLRDLTLALRPTRSPSPGPSELLDEHEKALARLFPDGKPSGDGSEHLNRHLELRHTELEWQLTVRKWLQVAGLLATFVSLASAIALIWNQLVA